jgi:hypothetical protein
MRTVTDKTIKLILPVALFTIFAGFVATNYLPSAAAENYQSEVKKESEELAERLDELSNTNQSQIFQTPDTAPAKSLQDCAKIKDQITATSQSVDSFNQKVQDLPSFNYPKFSDKYVRAEVTRSQANNITSQTREVLDNYQKMVEYLAVVSSARVNFESASSLINNPTSTRQISELDRILEDLKFATENLKNSNPPADLQTTKEDFASLLSQASQSTENYRAGQTNNAIQLIEVSANQYETNSRNNLYNLAVSSQILKDITSLPDKANSFSDL